LKRDQRIDVCRIIAAAVIEHLKRCGWRFDHPPSSAGAKPVRIEDRHGVDNPKPRFT
jgi:hypothetical protein